MFGVPEVIMHGLFSGTMLHIKKLYSQYVAKLVAFPH